MPTADAFVRRRCRLADDAPAPRPCSDPPSINAGNTSWIFSAAVATNTSRATLIGSILNYTARYGFDGVDLDWE